MKSLITLALLCCATMLVYAQNTGNVGIGTDDPKSKLHVAGDIKIDSLIGNGERNVTVGPDGKLLSAPLGMGNTPRSALELFDDNGDLRLRMDANQGLFQMLSEGDTIYHLRMVDLANEKLKDGETVKNSGAVDKNSVNFEEFNIDNERFSNTNFDNATTDVKNMITEADQLLVMNIEMISACFPDVILPKTINIPNIDRIAFENAKIPSYQNAFISSLLEGVSFQVEKGPTLLQLNIFSTEGLGVAELIFNEGVLHSVTFGIGSPFGVIPFRTKTFNSNGAITTEVRITPFGKETINHNPDNGASTKNEAGSTTYNDGDNDILIGQPGVDELRGSGISVLNGNQSVTLDAKVFKINAANGDHLIGGELTDALDGISTTSFGLNIFNGQLATIITPDELFLIEKNDCDPNENAKSKSIPCPKTKITATKIESNHDKFVSAIQADITSILNKESGEETNLTSKGMTISSPTSTAENDHDYWKVTSKQTGEYIKIGLRDVNEDGQPKALIKTGGGESPTTLCIDAPVDLQEINLLDENGEKAVTITSKSGKDKPQFCKGAKFNIGKNPSSEGIISNTYDRFFSKVNGTKQKTELGRVGEFFNFLTDNDDPAVIISTDGIGESAIIQTTNAENADPSLIAVHQGAGASIVGFNSGTGGVAEFTSGNAENTNTALGVFNFGLGRTASFSARNENGTTEALNLFQGGLGRGGSFFNSNINNGESALISFHAGNGSAITGVASGTGNAGEFFGDLFVSGTVTEQGSGFTIDHPSDKFNKKLSHSSVSSPEMMNIYNGNVVTDVHGLAEVKLPKYFEALNVDFRYQLTVIGTFAQAIISEKIAENTFTIQTNEPNVEVSWQVTGVRNDDYAITKKIKVESPKSEEQVGLLIFDIKNPKSLQGRYGDTNDSDQGIAFDQ